MTVVGKTFPLFRHYVFRAKRQQEAISLKTRFDRRHVECSRLLSFGARGLRFRLQIANISMQKKILMTFFEIMPERAGKSLETA